MALTQKMKVRVIPRKYYYLDMLHSLCGGLGAMLDALPNLKKHELIDSEDMLFREDPAKLALLDVEDSATPSSSNYFSHLHLNNIVACTSGLDHALDFLKLGQVR